MFKSILFISLFGMSALAHSEGFINNLKISNEIVYFSTTAVKSNTPPACVVAGNEEQWTMSLNSTTGKASYSLLIAALTENRKVTIGSANDCNAIAGFERAMSIKVGKPEEQLSGFYLFDGDNNNLGPIAEFTDIVNGIVAYLKEGNAQRLERVELPRQSSEQIFFTQDSCQGTPYTNNSSSPYMNTPAFNENKYFARQGSPRNRYLKSILISDGSCVATAGWVNVWELNLAYNHSFCGSAPCEIRKF